MSSTRNVRLLNEIIGEFKGQLSSTAMDLGALRSTINNDLVNEKIQGSFSGHFLDAAIRAITIRLLLFVTRTCEKAGHGIPNALELLFEEAQNIEQARIAKHPDWPKDFLEVGQVVEKVDAVKCKFNNLISSDSYIRARLLRDEKYAHLLKGKSDLRKRHRSMLKEFDDITYLEVDQLSEEVLLIVKEVIRIWTFELISVESKISIAQRYSNDFWKVLPILKEVERNGP